MIQDAAADLTEERNVAAQHRGAARQRFGERQAVTLCEGWKQQGACTLQHTGDGGVRQSAALLEAAIQAGALFQTLDDISPQSSSARPRESP